MITEEMLREAAEKAGEALTAYYERDYDSNELLEIPPEFEKKIERLKRRAKHPAFYKTIYRVASIALAILITSSVWITVDGEARAAVVGWIKEIYETYVVHIFDSKTPIIGESVDYRPTWLPDGYTELYCDDSEDTVFVAYSNDEGQMMNFSYIYAPDETKWLVDRNNALVTRAKVNDCVAELFISTDPDNANAIMWSNEDNTAFYLSAFLDEAELIRIAESVSPQKNN